MIPDPAGSLPGAIELLDRSLAYTRVTLAEVRPQHLGRPTPCARWSLAALLAHMEDGLDAFTEAAAGHVRVEPAPPSTNRVEALRLKACTLLAAWNTARPSSVAVGGLALDPRTLVETAALEITVHGWDVAQATGRGAAIPDPLASRLLDVARDVVGTGDRGRRFAAVRPVVAGASDSQRLLAFVGRSEAPDWSTTRELGRTASRPDVAS